MRNLHLRLLATAALFLTPVYVSADKGAAHARAEESPATESTAEVSAETGDGAAVKAEAEESARRNAEAIDATIAFDDEEEESPAAESSGRDPAEGFWIATNQRNGKYLCGWEFYVKDNMLCARILSATGATPETVAYGCTKSYPDYESDVPVNELKMFGTTFIYGLKYVKPGVWKGGYVIDPDSGNFYRCNIKYRKADGKRFKRDVLEMRGAIVWLPLLGVTQYWPSASFEEASGIL